MKLKIALFAAARQLLDVPTIDLEFDHPPTVKDVQATLVRLYPELESMMARSVIAVDHEYAMPDKIVEEGAELAVIPPVSGG